jgi:hypothetical protein
MSQLEPKRWDKGGRRSGIGRRQFSYFEHVPERRSGDERRCGCDRRNSRDRRNGNTFICNDDMFIALNNRSKF